jgi:hypothetical protein
MVLLKVKKSREYTYTNRQGNDNSGSSRRHSSMREYTKWKNSQSHFKIAKMTRSLANLNVGCLPYFGVAASSKMTDRKNCGTVYF